MPNPQTKEFPLRHKFAYDFALREYETSYDDHSVCLPLWMADQAKDEATAMDVQVNRQNDNYEGLVNTPAIYMNSRVNMLKLTEYYYVDKDYDLPDVLFQKSLITFGLGDSDKKDPQGNTILTALGFTKAADTIHPTWTGTKLASGSFCHADVDGLTTNQQLEQHGVSAQTLDDNKDGSLGPLVQKMVAGPAFTRVHKDFPYFRAQWYDTPSSAKRANAFTGCFLHCGLNTVADSTPTLQNTAFRPHFDTDLTIDEDAINCHILVEFNEYNDAFDQSA